MIQNSILNSIEVMEEKCFYLFRKSAPVALISLTIVGLAIKVLSLLGINLLAPILNASHAYATLALIAIPTLSVGVMAISGLFFAILCTIRCASVVALAMCETET